MDINEWWDACKFGKRIYYHNKGLFEISARSTTLGYTYESHEPVINTGDLRIRLSQVFSSQKDCVKSYIGLLEGRYLKNKGDKNV